ncbi:MAG: hypothetical protein AAF579_05780 [Cyanobacteria bacterium P01_C01_bin.118]
MPQTGKISKRRLFSLFATAAVASSMGIGLGSTLRFQVISVGQTPLFIPQQDFPPLAEWPPQVPLSADDAYDDVDAGWDTSPSQLVYKEPVSTDIETDAYGEEDISPEQPVIVEDTTRSMVGSLGNEQGVQDIVDDAYNTDSARPFPGVSDLEESENEDIQPIDAPQIELTEPVSESYPWFDKRPISDAEFTEGPVIIAPVNSSAVPDTSLD